MLQNIAVIGSTGSVGRQTIDVIQNNPDRYRLYGIAAYSNSAALMDQLQKFHPAKAALFCGAPVDTGKMNGVKNGTEFLSGKDSWEEIVRDENVDTVLFASSGTAALPALLTAIRHKKKIALANKEMIVCDGELIMREAKKYGVDIVPVDSEHSAIYQCLRGEDPKNISKVILTCSGGPFRGYTKEKLKNVTVAQALSHPTWNMGKEISINSATLMNKSLEMIEAMHLFGLKPDQIEILVHPESIVHAFVEFVDGSVKALLNNPDMRFHIAYALSAPERFPAGLKKIDWQKLSKLTFEKPDTETFPLPLLAREVMEKGGNFPAAFVAANEEAVNAFLRAEIQFLEIGNRVAREVMEQRKTVTTATKKQHPAIS